MIAGALKRQVQGGEFNYIDAHFADMLARLAQTTGTRASPALIPWFARLSHALTRQHSCLDLSSLPESDELIAELTSLSIVGSPADTNFPLILDGTRLYMQRYFQYESRIANALAERNRLLDDIDVAQAIEITRSRFPETGWQQVAALQALTRQLSIITGGPGTGKTTTVVRIIRAIVELAGEEIPAIRLAAPTGKAAMRLMEALREQNLPVDLEVQTLHRLLGMRADGRSYRHGPEFPVSADLLIVDEVSMIDLAMMHRLVGALRADARVILLGDPGQLPSVEAGNILADICKHPAGYTSAFADIAKQVGMVLPITDSGHLLADAICELKQSYRFLPDKGIGRLSHAIRAGDNITIEDDEEVTFTSLAAFGADQQVAVYEHYIDTLAATRDPLTRLATFEQ
ncbi:MAG: AAA family ATPase, partial [Pseudomonadales bacterium]